VSHVDVYVLAPGLVQALTYAVPAASAVLAVPGARVRVPLQQRARFGVILRLAAPLEGAKLLSAVLTDEPRLSAAQLDLVGFLIDYYACPPADALRMVLPPDAPHAPKARYALTEFGEQARFFFKTSGLTPKDVALLARFADGTQLDDGRLKRLEVSPARLRDLVERGFLERHEPAAPTPRHDESLLALPAGQPLPERARALAAFDAWVRARTAADHAAPTLEQARALFPDARGRVTRLVALSRLRIEPIIRVRDVRATSTALLGRPVAQLSDHQRDAVAAIDAALRQRKGAFLLEGVTGSGKTEVYLHALRSCLSEGRGAILLVPEISLTNQLTARVRAAVQEDVIVLHSGLGPAERRDAHARLRMGQTRIVVGARSALFAPVPSLGLIIVDEEHDGSLKQDESPRYHARDVALWLGRSIGAVCVLGSATPSYESLHNVRQKKLHLLRLPTRVAGATAPTITLIDLRKRSEHQTTKRRDRALDDHGGAVLSGPLVQAIEDTLASGKQSLLFLNKRGYFSTVLCRTCGTVRGCPECSLPLTVHANHPSMAGSVDVPIDPLRAAHWRCHGCGYVERPPSQCEPCGAIDSWRCIGVGTARVEAEVRARFPTARLARLDRDVHKTAHGLAEVTEAIAAGEVDIVIGTQLIAKGHDWPGVALVGVVSADVALAMPDFRANERAIALLMQVAGRAGRAGGAAQVLVQTFQPDHPVLQALLSGDVATLTSQEMESRALLRYPPLARLLLVRVEGEDSSSVVAMATEAAQLLRSANSAVGRVLGPAPCALERLAGRFRWQVLVQSPSLAMRHSAIQALRERSFSSALTRANTRLILDVDPMHML
jgi:primosomal protein N' (replication factor Y) (superfamily II helicase)